MIISVKHQPTSRFDSDEYLIDLDRKFEGYENGDLICGLTPFYPMPLRLEIAISRNGNLKFRAWKWVNGCNNYLHTYQNLMSLRQHLSRLTQSMVCSAVE